MGKCGRSVLVEALLGLTLLALAACATTELTKTWRRPDYKGPPLTRLLVVGISKQAAMRRTFEDEFVKQLKASGLNAVASYTLIPEPGPIGEAQLTQALKEAGSDGMLITRLVRADVDTQFTPAFRPTAGTSLAAGYSAAWTGYHEPAASSQPDTVILETDLYGINESQHLWSGTTRTFATTSELQKDIEGFAKLVIGALKEQKLI